MLKNINDKILSALKQYECDPDCNQKKAILLTPQGGYFLYGNCFCSITAYELEFFSETFQMQGATVRQTLFLGILQDGFHAVGKEAYHVELVSLIFRIDLGEEEPLRGILLAQNQNAEFTLFSDISVEKLYRLSRRVAMPSHSDFIVPPDETLCQYAETLRQNDLHKLIKLYSYGNKLKSLSAR